VQHARPCRLCLQQAGRTRGTEHRGGGTLTRKRTVLAPALAASSSSTAFASASSPPSPPTSCAPRALESPTHPRTTAGACARPHARASAPGLYSARGGGKRACGAAAMSSRAVPPYTAVGGGQGHTHPGAGHGVERGQERAAGLERHDDTIGHRGRVSQFQQERLGLRLVFGRTPRHRSAPTRRRFRQMCSHFRPVRGEAAAGAGGLSDRVTSWSRQSRNPWPMPWRDFHSVFSLRNHTASAAPARIAVQKTRAIEGRAS
jgi:hypothetical protein